MASMENISIEFKLAESKKDSLLKTLEHIQSQAFSMISFSRQGKDLTDNLDSVQKSISQSTQDLESRRKHLDSLEEKLNLKEKHLNLEEKSIQKRAEKVSSEETFLVSLRKSSKEFSDKVEESVQKAVQEYELLRKSVEEQSQDVEQRKKQLDCIHKLISEEFESRKKELELKEKAVQESLENVRLQEEKFKLLSEEVESKKKKLELSEKAVQESLDKIRLEEEKINLFQISMKERYRKKEKFYKERLEEVEKKEKRLAFEQNNVQERSRRLDSRRKKLELHEMKVHQRHKDIKLKEHMFGIFKSLVEGRYQAIQLEEKRLESIRKSSQLVEEQLEEVDLKGSPFNFVQESTEQLEEVDLRGSQFNLVQESTIKHCKELPEKQPERMQNSIELRSQVLGWKEKRLNALEKKVRLKEKQLEEKEKRLEEKEKQLVNIPSLVNIDESDSSPADNTIDSSSAKVQFCVTMDGTSLQIFLNKCLNEHELMRHDISFTLRRSSDPAKVVLDAMQGFYPPHTKEGDVEFEVNVIRRSCILLLEQLLEVSPDIKPCVKEEAMEVAGKWKANMRADSGHVLEVLGFLQLLATYGLIHAFDVGLLLHLIATVGGLHRLSPQLRRALGLAEAIPAHATKVQPPQHGNKRPRTECSNQLQ